MNIAFVWPMGFDINLIVPLSFGYLKSNIDTKHNIKIIDCALDRISSGSKVFERELKEFKPQVVGVSCWSTTFDEAIRICKKVKMIDQDIITVLGGVHPTSYPEEVMKNNAVDYLFRGEAELTFSKLIDEISKENPEPSKIGGLVYRSIGGKIVFNNIEREENLDRIKIPDYDAIRLDEYIEVGYRYFSHNKRNAPILVTRGCPYQCNYCAVPIQNGKQIRSHSIEYVEDWVKYLYYKKDIRTINIIDDNFTFYSAYAKKFCEAMIRLNLKDLSFGTPNGIPNRFLNDPSTSSRIFTI